MNEKQKKELLFVGKFFAIFLVLSTLISFVELEEFTSGIAFIVGGMLSVPVQGNLLFAGGEVFEITNHCTGLLSIAILGAVVFSLRKPELMRKVRVFLIGSAVLLPLNVLRIAGVVLVGAQFGGEIAELMHVISWFVATGIILGLWYYLSLKEVGQNLEEML